MPLIAVRRDDKGRRRCDNNERASSTSRWKTRPRRCCIMNGSFTPRPRQSLFPLSALLSLSVCLSISLCLPLCLFPFRCPRTARDRHDLLGGRAHSSIINYFERSRAVDPAERDSPLGVVGQFVRAVTRFSTKPPLTMSKRAVVADYYSADERKRDSNRAAANYDLPPPFCLLLHPFSALIRTAY